MKNINTMTQKLGRILTNADRISYEEFATLAVPLIKQAYENGEMNVPNSPAIDNPDAPILMKVNAMCKQVGENTSKERIDAGWLFHSTIGDLINQHLPVEKQKELKQQFKEIYYRCVDKLQLA